MKKLVAAALGMSLALTGIAMPAVADAKGDEIAHKYFDLKKADDTRAPGSVMTLIDKSGGRKTRRMDIFYQEKATGKNAYMVFSEPADVNGTKFLTIGHRGADSDERLYLPALKKTRRIAASGKDGEFVNSDLWFYDLEERYFEDNTYTFLSDNETIADKAFDGMKFAKIEMRPTKADCPYARAVAFVNMADNFVYRMDCYDKKDGSLLKTIQFVSVDQIKGVLVPTRMIVSNFKKGTKTLLQLNGVEVNVGLKDEVFSVKNLEQ